MFESSVKGFSYVKFIRFDFTQFSLMILVKLKFILNSIVKVPSLIQAEN